MRQAGEICSLLLLELFDCGGCLNCWNFCLFCCVCFGWVGRQTVRSLLLLELFGFGCCVNCWNFCVRVLRLFCACFGWGPAFRVCVCRWDFFLSHLQTSGGDLAQTTSLRLEQKGKTVWYDQAMENRCEKRISFAMAVNTFGQKTHQFTKTGSGQT